MRRFASARKRDPRLRLLAALAVGQAEKPLPPRSRQLVQNAREQWVAELPHDLLAAFALEQQDYLVTVDGDIAFEER